MPQVEKHAESAVKQRAAEKASAPDSTADDLANEEGATAFEAYFDANRNRAVAIHEASHAAVAHVLGAPVAFVEMDLATGGGSHSQNFADPVTISGSVPEAAEPSTLSMRPEEQQERRLSDHAQAALARTRGRAPRGRATGLSTRSS